MLMKKNIFLGLWGLIFFVSCGASSGEPSQGTVRLFLVDWEGEIAATSVAKNILQRMGYKAESFSVTTSVMYQSIASGDGDAMLASWVPTADKAYYEKLQDQFDDLGPNYEGTLQGFVVPRDVELKSITDLVGQGARFDHTIAGIDAGAGSQLVAEEVVQAYGLSPEYTLTTGSEATMLATLQAALTMQKDVIVLAWRPHWMFSRFDLKFLEDPQGIFGGAETVNTLVRKGLKDDMPEVYEVLDAFFWTDDIQADLLLANHENGRIDENAARWVEQHRDLVSSWLPASYKERDPDLKLFFSQN